MKILFTSVGRRVELMQAFRKAADELKSSGELKDDLTIIGADITDTAPALYFCDETRIVPRIKDKSYIPVLLEICQEEAVDCLIPTIDTDLLLLAENKPISARSSTTIVSELLRPCPRYSSETSPSAAPRPSSTRCTRRTT